MTIDARVPKRISSAILSSLSAGVVPRIGLEYITVGRKREVEAVLTDFRNISQGAGAFRLIVGRYGSGKSFLLQMIRNSAMDRGFLVADVDLSPEKRLTGAGNQGLMTYRELMQRLSVKLRPDGGALEAVLQKYIQSVRAEAIEKNLTGQQADALVSARIMKTFSSLTDYAHGFDFAQVLKCYYSGFSTGNEELRQAALKWLRGEFATKTEAKKLLPVGEIIGDDNWYEAVKLFAAFFSRLGFAGLLLFFDECASLYKIHNRQARENNYEKILALFNDAMQGKAEHLGIYLSGTPQFVEDERRGLFGYEALKRRLCESRFSQDGHVDYTGPMLRLSQLTNEEVYVLLEKLTEIHGKHYEYQSRVTGDQILLFLQTINQRLGSNRLLTPGEAARDYLSLLNILMLEPNTRFEDLVHPREEADSPEEGNDEYESFTL